MGNTKRVTFADFLGFSLVSVIEIAPRIKHTKQVSVYQQPRYPKRWNNQRYFRTCLFEQPVNREDFLDRIKKQFVCLESVVCDKTIIRGFVRVLNVAYRKEVTVRYSTDGWKTMRNERADYLSTSSNGSTDTFFFRIILPAIWLEKVTVEFAICYSVEGNIYWDNNNFKNYSIYCAKEETGV